MANEQGLTGACCIKNRFQEPQAGWSFVLPDGVSIPMIIDSGASFSFLSRGAWEKTRTLMKPVDIGIQKTAQVRSTILGYIEDVTFKHPPDTIHFDKLLVVEGAEVALYLNFLTLNQLGANIDFTTGVLDINLQKPPIEMSVNNIPALPLPVPIGDTYNMQNINQQSYQENNRVAGKDKIEDQHNKLNMKNREKNRSRHNRRARSREIRKKLSVNTPLIGNSNNPSEKICFQCKKFGHDRKNCPMGRSETLKVETHFTGGNSEPIKHERNSLLIPVSTNAGGSKRIKIPEVKRNLQQTSNQDSFARSQNQRRDNRNDVNRGTGNQLASIGKTNTDFSHNNLVRIPQMNTLHQNHNSSMQNPYQVFPQPFPQNTSNSITLTSPNFIQSQVPLQARLSNYAMFNAGLNKFM